MLVDLRSDTVTKPTPAMREAMFAAEVGDDVFGEDPSVNQLEEKCARLLGMDAAVFCPSGTMTNQIGIRVLTQPYQEVICYQGAHIYKYEGGGLAGNSLVSVRLLPGNRGRLSPDEVKNNINNAADAHQPITSVVALENTVVREAGSFYTLQQIAPVAATARQHQIKMHLDGPRLFNALTESGNSPGAYGQYFDTISICLSKGLGAPVGSVLCCKKEWAVAAKRMRKAFGGGMRQAGYLAAAGIYALDNHIQRLREDHQRARELGQCIGERPWVKYLMPINTNILIFEVADGMTTEKVLAALAAHHIKAVAFGPGQIRMVTHLDFTDNHLEYTISTLKKLNL